MLQRYLGLSRSWRELLHLLGHDAPPQEESDLINCLIRWYYPLVDIDSLTLPLSSPQVRGRWEVLYKKTAVFQDVLELAGTLYFSLSETNIQRVKNWSDFYVAKDFEEAYTENVWQRFGGLRSSNATRLSSTRFTTT